MGQSKGYAQLVGPEGNKEWDTLTCGHCQRIVQIRPFCPLEEVGGHCRPCNKFLCPDCETKRANGQPCIPWAKQMDVIEARERARASYGV